MESKASGLIGLLVVLIIGLAGLGGYWFAKPSDNYEPTRPATVVLETNDNTTDADQDQPTTDETGSAMVAEEPALQFLRVETDMSDPDLPAACLRFSSAPDAARVIDDKAFINVSPETPFSLDVRNTSLCILGLSVETSYSVRILAGFTAADGQVLGTQASADIAFEPKPAMVGFVSDGIILPRTNSARIGLKAMNADQVKLVLYRVNHRALFNTNPNSGETAIEGDWSYNYDAYRSRVEVHSETIDMSGDINQLVERGYSLGDIVEANGPGAYIIEISRDASADVRRPARAWRWLYVTDIALASYRSEEALHVTARSIETAKTLPGVRVAVIARNNDVLAEAETDRSGRVTIPGAAIAGQGNLAPRMLLAYAGGDDFAALDLSRSPLDLTGFDVAGRNASGPIEAFFYTDRGVYRPGETVHLNALIRDRSGRAAFDRDGTLTVAKPDGSTQIELRVSPTDQAGSLYRALTMPNGAPRGRYTATLLLDGIDKPIGSIKWAVEDFVPEQLRLDVRAETTPLSAGETRAVTIAADFLYGAPGRGLESEVDARLQVDPNPFAEFKGYQFGDATQTFRERFLSVDNGQTNEDGRFEATLDLGQFGAETTQPLRAFLTVGVAEPSGRYIRDSLFLPVRAQDVYVGFKPAFENGYARRNTPADIDIIALNRLGEPVAAQVTLRLIRERYDYQWYRENGRWRYRRDRRDGVQFEREVTITDSEPFRFSRPLDYGQYRLEVERDGAISSIQFGSGWRRSDGGSAAPDKIELGLDASSYTPGDTLAVTLDAPFAGEAEVVIADGDVQQIDTVSIVEGTQTLRLKTQANSEGDLYVMVTLYEPLSDRAPRRAVGLVHVPKDRDAHVLSLSVDAPETIRPRTEQTITLDLGNRRLGDAYLTLAAVDTGILQITDFSPPDPVATLFAKQAFGLDVFDDYARMLAPFTGRDRVGGDTLGGAGLSVVPTQTVALFEGPISVQNGRATVQLDIPDFQGELTLMAVAWTEDQIGSASTKMTVRDPVTSQLSLPRFLAPGDKVVATVSIDNVDGQAGDYSTTVDLNSARLSSFERALALGERADEGVSFEAADLGISTFSLATRGPDFSVARDYQIETRAAALPKTRTAIIRLDPGEQTTVDLIGVRQDFLPNSVDYTVSATFSPLMDAAVLMEGLRRYPYGCTEQTVSVAVPLLLSEQLGTLPGQSAQERREALQAAVDRLLARQDASGAIGLWRQGDRRASPYLQLYASEFLLDAAEAGYTVPDAALNRTKEAVRSLSKLDGSSGLALDYQFGLEDRNPNYERRKAERAAYALAILARHDRVKKTDVTYLHDRLGDTLMDSVSLSHLGYTLFAIGETDRARVSFERAGEALLQSAAGDYFATPIRNAAALIALYEDIPSDLATVALGSLPSNADIYLNTHEKAWLLRAIAKEVTSTTTRPFANDPTWTASGRSARRIIDRNDETLSFGNPHDSPIWVTLNASGQPKGLDVAMSRGARLQKSVFTMDGTPLDGSSIARGERAIILLEAEAGNRTSAMWVLADLLPAGFEIETILQPTDAGEKGPFAWLETLDEVDMSEARDDRFVASWRTGTNNRYDTKRQRRVAYIVRAVSEGDFAFPGAHIEDMYRPDRMATTEGGRLQITQGGEL